MNKILLGLCFLVGACRVMAEEQKPILPQFPAGPAAWTVTVKDVEKTGAKTAAEPGANEKVSLIRIETVVTTKARCDRFFWSDHTTAQIWMMDGYIIMDDKESKSIYVTNKGAMKLSQDELLFDRGTIAWTQKSGLPKKALFKGSSCWLYVRGDSSQVSGVGEEVDLSELNFGESVFVDGTTGFPHAYVRAGRVYEFTFLSAPSTFPSMPEAFARKLERVKMANVAPVTLPENR